MVDFPLPCLTDSIWFTQEIILTCLMGGYYTWCLGWVHFCIVKRRKKQETTWLISKGNFNRLGVVLCWSCHLKLLRGYPLRSLISFYDELYFQEWFFRGSAASHTPKFFTSKLALQTVNCRGDFFSLEKIQELGPIPCDSLYINLPVNSGTILVEPHQVHERRVLRLGGEEIAPLKRVGISEVQVGDGGKKMWFQRLCLWSTVQSLVLFLCFFLLPFFCLLLNCCYLEGGRQQDPQTLYSLHWTSGSCSPRSMEENGSHLANCRWEECHRHSGAHPRTFPRDIFWFSKVCRNPRALNYLPPLFPRKSEQRPDTSVFLLEGWMAAEAWSLGGRHVYQAPSPFAIYAPCVFPRTFAVEQGQKSPQHGGPRHAESDWPPLRGSSWGVETAHDGLDESYGPKDLLLLKKPMFRQCFT